MESKEIGEKGGKCNQLDCFRKAVSGVVIKKKDVYFCDEHAEEALELLN